ncbi:hypothetical protein H3N56_09365 [Cetobacterium sp. 2A]|uniref:nucleoside recognition domain-containing protein n=1 Tax=Cetobacterium sp. 2A TaxID=2754723 RepID=UPI00163B7588|nr:nucleoside recognition domain-containing protein [Cetobacterium sp. 2A]MBC2856655.1 hypothetical protein [Cetobacterium sp. 2A]
MLTAEQKKSITGWASLFILIIMFSGLLKDFETLKAFDFSYLLGKFGIITNKINFTGKGGEGTREGFLIALTLAPSLMLSSGLITVAQELGALEAASKFFSPILRPLMGIPGSSGLAFVSSFTSSDVGAIMTRELHDDNYITEEERAIFVAYQYASSGVVTNTISAGGPLLGISLLPLGGIIMIQFIMKIIGANLVRVIIKKRNLNIQYEV